MLQIAEPRVMLVERESDLLKLAKGSLTRVMLPSSKPKFMVYEGVTGSPEFQIYSFIEQKVNDEENPYKILSHRNGLRYLQFDDQHGIIFNHLYYDIVIYDSGQSYFAAQRMLRESNKWQDFEQVKVWSPKK
ncbi:hypothetical protein J4477_02590 [Candidatus Pacearchaeota archaeon]|nr:hypothetical protein [Candidatus Pacearchaeota archaeon]